jgi:hypothetical protein
VVVVHIGGVTVPASMAGGGDAMMTGGFASGAGFPVVPVEPPADPTEPGLVLEPPDTPTEVFEPTGSEVTTLVPGVATPASAEPDEPDEPEHPISTSGWQVKASPQSESVVQGSCHLKAHREVVVVVQVVGVGAGVGGQTWFGAQAGVEAAPPLQVVYESV